jgi:hypothetical protein
MSTETLVISNENTDNYNEQLSKGLPLRPCRHYITVNYDFKMFSRESFTLDSVNYTEPEVALTTLYHKANIKTVTKINSLNDIDVYVSIKNRTKWLKLGTFIKNHLEGSPRKKRKIKQAKTEKEPDIEKEETGNDSGLCKICLECASDYIVYPCGHLHTCIGCGEKHQKDGQLCIICRETIILSFKVFHDY